MKNIAIFASGSGTNAENIVKLFHQGNRIRVAVVLSNKEDAGVHERMQRLGVPTMTFPNSVWATEPEKIVEALAPYGIDLVVLAGFMRCVESPILDAYPHRVINIHPALLPAYGGKGMYGHHVHQAVVAAGEKKSGVTVHYVTNEIDGGDIIMQQEVDVTPDDTAETLEAKIHPVEYALYPRAIAEVVRGLEAAPSVDEAWAKTLHLNYSEEEAARLAKPEAAPVSGPASEDSNAAYEMPPVPGVPPRHPSLQTPASGGVPPAPYQPADNVEKPKSYLWVSILMAVFFSTICGIVAIVFSCTTNSRNSQGDYEAAAKASRKAQIWIIVSFVLGLLQLTVWMPISFFSTLFMG